MRFRVLHVEDEPDIREVVKISLALDPDMTVKSCDDGKAALHEAADWQPDVILMDAVMPVMDGPEVFENLRNDARTAAIPVVFMTARTQEDDVAQFMSVGRGRGDRQAVRPVDARQIRARLPGRLPEGVVSAARKRAHCRFAAAACELERRSARRRCRGSTAST